MSPPRPGRALVLLSGGLDSTVALWWAAAQGYEPVALTFLYPGRPRGEESAARAIVAAAEVDAREVPLPFLREAEDVDAARFADAPPGYTPFRNAIFYAIACHHAQTLRCPVVVGGHNKEDAETYPDAGAAFFDELQAVLQRGAWRGGGEAVPPKLLMPLISLDRNEVLGLGLRLGAPVARTWSCHEDGEAPCRACPACARSRVLA